ncbi:MAG: hypothetical protein LBF15_02540 [Candidatus Peribacteria bacterium]|nr:hypothetical protein [Candidatus Peribacteria bacterium]
MASDNNPRTSLFLGGSTSNEIFAFRVQARNDNIRLNDLTFSGAGLDNFSNFRLRTPSGAFVSASTASSGAVTFRDMNLSETVNADNTATFFIVADANTNTNATGIVIGFDDSVTALNQFRGTNGQLYGLTGVTANISGNPHAVSDNRAVVAKASNPSKEITSSALRFTVTASGRDAVVLSGASLDVSLSGYDVGS